MELNTALVLLGAFGALAAAANHCGYLLLQSLRAGLSLDTPPLLTPESVRNLFLAAAAAIGGVLAPILLAAVACGILSNLLQVGFMLAPQALRFDWARLQPGRGLAQLFSGRGGVESLKAFLKFGLLGGVAYATLRPEADRLPELAGLALPSLVAWQAEVALRLAFRVLAAYLVLALADYLYQRWQYERSLRMSRTEIREESRQQEGNPQVRARIRSLQQQRAMHRMMQEVPQASVVVVNPTHLAVALRYDRSMVAPRVVAKGQRLIAERIVALAKAHGVPVLQDIPLAWALYKHVQVGAEIPVAFYRAVARILAYVLAHERRGGEA
jgi:flagellar biosynthetic protein FlhB